MPVCNFFLLDPREGPKERTKNLPGLRGPDGEVIFSSLYEKTDENHFIFVGFFLCAWAQYAGLQFFPHGSGGGVPRNAQKINRGCMVQRVKLYFRHCTIKGSKITFKGFVFFVH